LEALGAFVTTTAFAGSLTDRIDDPALQFRVGLNGL
jgi:hypothetical protein